MQLEARHEAAAREEGVGLLDVAADKDVLPRDEYVVHDEDRVILIEPARQRVIKRAPDYRSALFIGDTADQFHSLRIGRHQKDQREFGVLHRDQPVAPDEGEMGQRRPGGDDLGTRDVDPGIGFLCDMRVDVGRAARLTGHQVAVDRRVEQRVADKRHPLLAVAVPAARIFLIRVEKFGVAAEAGEQSRLVIGRAAEPAPGQPCPLRDPIATGDEVFGRARRDEIRVGETAPFGRTGQQVFLFRMVAMQRVVEPRHHPRGITEGGMLGDVLDALAVDPHLSAVVEAVEKFLAGIGKQCRHRYRLPGEAEDAGTRLLRYARNDNLCHCEERCDEAISFRIKDKTEVRKWHG